MAVHNGFPTDGFNGSVLTGRKVSPLVGNVHTEMNTLINAYGGDPYRMQFGLLKQWYQYKLVPASLFLETELNGHIVETPAAGSIIDYWVPYSTGGAVILDNLLPATVEKPGYGKSKFPVIFSHQFSPGDIITNMFRNGVEIQVSRDEEVVPDGGGYRTYLETPGNDPEEWISREVLGPETTWVKLAHYTGEHDVQATYLSDPYQTGLARYSYQTGNSEIHIKHWITSVADRASFTGEYKGFATGSQGLSGFAEAYNKLNIDTVTTYYKYVLGQDGKRKPVGGKDSIAWMPTIIELMLKELALMKSRSLMWAKGYETQDAAGKIFKVPTGYYHWVKTYGTYADYSDLNELKPLVDEIMTKLFAGRGDLDWKNRRIRWRAGLGAFTQLSKQFMTDFNRDNPFLIVNDGRNPFLNGMISGKYDALSFSQPKIVTYEYPNLGVVELEHEPSLDFLDANNPSVKMYNGLSETSYMLFIEDITSDSFSNAFSNKEHVKAIGSLDYNNGPNVIQLKPKGFVDGMGFIAGMGSPPTLAKFAGINQKQYLASTERRGFGVQAWTTGEIFIKDPSRIALIEFIPSKVYF